MTTEITILGTDALWEQFQRNPLEIHQAVAVRMKKKGIKEAPTLSRALEEISPTEDADKSGLDAFERLMKKAGIRTNSDPVTGYYASNAGLFSENAGTRALLIEFCARNWRKVSMGQLTRQERAILLSEDSVIGSWARPWADASMPKYVNRVEPAIPLSEIVAMTTPIDGDSYRSLYLTYDSEQLRKFRVGESAEIPIATVATSERVIRMRKFGRGIRASYEDLRRMRVDRLAWHIQQMAVQAEIDKVAAALDTLVNGDGNSGTTPTSYDLTTLDSGTTANNLTVKAWIAFRLKFAQPYVITTALMREDVALKLATLNTGSANVPLAAADLGGLNLALRPINRTADAVGYGWLSDAPADKIVGFDNRMSIEYVTEVGSMIAETERYVTNQTQIMVMSEVDGFAVLDAAGVKLLNLAA